MVFTSIQFYMEKKRNLGTNLINGALKEFLDNKYDDSKYQEVYSKHLEKKQKKNKIN